MMVSSAVVKMQVAERFLTRSGPKVHSTTEAGGDVATSSR
jgi:hypothetical protein